MLVSKSAPSERVARSEDPFVIPFKSLLFRFVLPAFLVGFSLSQLMPRDGWLSAGIFITAAFASALVLAITIIGDIRERWTERCGCRD